MTQLPVGKVPPDLLRRFVYTHLGTRRPDVFVRAGIGEDCASITFGDEVAVLTTDPITGAGQDLGWYAVCVATNDLAAAGAEPVALMLTVLLRPGQSVEDLARVMREAGRAAESLGIEIVGGHSEVTSGIDRTIVVVTAVGRAPRDAVLGSGGAHAGDDLVLTKGAGIEGTAILAADLEARLRLALGDAIVDRARAFRERISVLPEGRAATRAGARAMHDVTEGGVLGAVHEMAVASGIGVWLDADRVPVPDETAAICAHFGADPLALIGSGALLIATPDPGRVLAAVAAAGAPAAVIGAFRPAATPPVVRRAGREAPLVPPARDELWRILEEAARA
ncbi:MAG TPA: AIR synthase family protein [bacterium]|nr:AIR synthase family protein [bacterium]